MYKKVDNNLDKIPECYIDDNKCVVKQASKGVYFAEISNEMFDMVEESIYYDKWSEIFNSHYYLF